MVSVSLRTNLAGIRLKNPTILASGFLGISPENMKRVQNCGAGAITAKTIGFAERPGHNNPSILGWDCGVINAVGLSGEGLENVEWKGLGKIRVPLIISVFDETVSGFGKIVKEVAKHKPAAIELNLSCPNKGKGMLFSLDKKLAYRVVRKAKENAGRAKIFAKLTPQAPDIAEVAKACEKAGADAITAINTLGPGMLIDIEARKKVLAFGRGGLSGPAIKPVAVRCVYDIYENVKIPVIGVGGVTSGRDAIEMIMAGATAVGIGTAIYYRGIDVFEKISMEMQGWMKKNKIKSLSEIRGAAHV